LAHNRSQSLVAEKAQNSSIYGVEKETRKKWKRKKGLAWLANGDLALVGLRLRRRFLGLAGSSLGQISLVAFSLCVGQVITLVVVECQAKLALITTTKLPNQNIRTKKPKSNMHRERKRETDRERMGYLPRWLRIK
jgi:hypothetical protein